jgi:hypothetical protein
MQYIPDSLYPITFRNMTIYRKVRRSKRRLAVSRPYQTVAVALSDRVKVGFRERVRWTGSIQIAAIVS